MNNSIYKVGIFCGSSTGAHPAYARAAADLGASLARRGMGIVYGGGCVGLMGVLADAALGAGGEVVGVTPYSLVEREVAHRGLTQLHVVDTMHERKQMMADLADAFVLLPGGFGSWDEFCEIVTWVQLGIHRKPCGILNVADYYAPLLAMADRGVEEGFIRKQNRDWLVVDSDVESLVTRLVAAPPPPEAKWLSPTVR